MESKKVLVVGDIIIDEYVHVETTRRAQEADISVYDIITKPRVILGGAANVALNFKALAGDYADVYIAGVVGAIHKWRLEDAGIKLDERMIWGNTLTKLRYVDDGVIVTRVDNRKKFEDTYVEWFNALFDHRDFSGYDMVIISDYDKGTVGERVARKIVESGIPTIVDSKRYDLSIYRGAKYLNINEHEYSEQVSNKQYTNVESLFDYVLVTLGDRGAELRQCELVGSEKYIVHTEQFTTDTVSVVDVTGCGDTHTAAFALGVLRDPLDVRQAVRYANKCATLAVQQLGNRVVTRWDLSKNLQEE